MVNTRKSRQKLKKLESRLDMVQSAQNLIADNNFQNSIPKMFCKLIPADTTPITHPYMCCAVYESNIFDNIFWREKNLYVIKCSTSQFAPKRSILKFSCKSLGIYFGSYRIYIHGNNVLVLE